MLAALREAICAELGQIPGVATCRPYAGELADAPTGPLLVPAVLVLLQGGRVMPDCGGGQVTLRASFSAFCCVRHVAGASARDADAWDLVEAVLIATRGQTWGTAGVSPALLTPAERQGEEPVAVPLWTLEKAGLAVREVRWVQDCTFGETTWTADIIPTELFTGHEPLIGDADGDAEDYEQVYP